ncbi:MAG TPA: hypothetical protein VMU89_14930 [Thermomicrobiaceae bacterium]|nr:hypothetical protein [Thermomicrobiaceae bacterium]
MSTPIPTEFKHTHLPTPPGYESVTTTPVIESNDERAAAYIRAVDPTSAEAVGLLREARAWMQIPHEGSIIEELQGRIDAFLRRHDGQ